MFWVMYYLMELVIISTRYIGGRKLTCFDCDSRYDVSCMDPFNKTAPMEAKPPIRECFGCCLKIIHKFPKDHKRRGGEDWVQRTCTENIIINYFMVDHVCMSEGKGHGKMCFCETDLCNTGVKNAQTIPTTLIITATTLALILSYILSSNLTLNSTTQTQCNFTTSTTDSNTYKSKLTTTTDTGTINNRISNSNTSEIPTIDNFILLRHISD